jgi:AraC family transcriptional regulator
MDESKLAALASQAPIDPHNFDSSSIVLSSQSLGLESMLFWRRQAPFVEWYAPPMTQHVVTVRLQKASKLVYMCNGHSYEGPGHAGEVTIMRAEQSFFWYVEEMNSLCIALAPSFMQRLALETCGLDPKHTELLDFCKTHDGVLRNLARLFLTELRTGLTGGQLYAESLGNVLALHLLRTYSTQRPALRFYQGGLAQYQVRRVADYIQAHLAQPLTLSELAGLLQMSPAHFIRAFRRTMGYTPYQYLIQCRIERAKALLTMSPHLPIRVIAAHVGLPAHSHFTALFRKLTGLSPTAYRNEQLGRSAASAPPDDTTDTA